MFRKKESGLPAIPTLSVRQLQAGQILLIVILIIIVFSTIGLSIASRTIISIRTSTEEAESQKALAAAEAGVERAIQGNAPATGSAILSDNLRNKSNYSVDVTQIDSSNFLINGGNLIPKDEGADVWFAGHDTNGNPDVATALSPNFVYLYWGLSSETETCGTSTAPAAIQAIVIASSAAAVTYRFAYDPCNRGNNFATPDTGSFNIGGKTFTYVTENLAKGGIVFIRVIPIYRDAVVGVNACDREGSNCTSLPSQGYVISSTGISGEASRKITVFKGYPQTYLPYLSYGLFTAN